ncbi:MAG: hypothetical protein JWN69_2023 [Alphaproteobacteria bacterium]|jgi:hypothetical protein|nr:hypothetical protein [Alphaproteobacteria bacterium]
MLMLALLTAMVAPSDGKTMAADDWHSLTILEVGSEPAGATRYVRVAAGDLDGDGTADEAILKLTCAGGALKEAHYVKSPRDSASGQASGKRMHKPFTFVKEWDAASPQLLQMKPTYDVKTLKGARTAATTDDWRPITLSAADGLCAATPAAATTKKSRSNISNN